VVPGVRLVVLGKQGAGKGTQCVRLSHHYVVPHVSTGDMLRAAVKSGSDLGTKVKEVMDRGELLGDDIIMEMVAERLAEPDARARGFILDGCPRTTRQAETLAALMAPGDIDLVVDIEVPTVQVMRRLASRRVCTDCGTNYSVTTPPKVNWTCDICGGEVIQREDDIEEAIVRRLELYERQTAPLIEWYEQRGQLTKINGVGATEAVLRRVIRAIEERRGQWPVPGRRPRGPS
jgi:adenylate kinase